MSIYYKFRFVFRAIYKKEPRAHLLWILKKGYAKFYKDFDLEPGSVFFDVGGFEGDYTSNILQEYEKSFFDLTHYMPRIANQVLPSLHGVGDLNFIILDENNVIKYFDSLYVKVFLTASILFS